MKKVITYGTFDLLHQWHVNLLKRAKALWDYMIVGVTTENYDKNRWKLNVHQDIMQRIENVKATWLADQVIIEEYEWQKIDDIVKYAVDVFAIWSDWTGKFDYLNEYCKVIYLERTKGISSTQIRAQKGIVNVGIIGYGRIAKRFIAESKFVSGVEVTGVYGHNQEKLQQFCTQEELAFYTTDISDFFQQIDAVYIASPHITHYAYIKQSLLANKHVLCEKPLVLRQQEAEEVYALAEARWLVLLEAIKTAYCPWFHRLISMAKSGLIGQIINVDATFTKLVKTNTREMDQHQAGGSVTELASYPLLAIIKLLGVDYTDISFDSYMDPVHNVDLFTKMHLKYNNAFATAKVGIGVKSEGDMIIAGTKWYIYVPAPWWKTEYYELRFEDTQQVKRVFYKFDGDGLRYELTEFVKMITLDNNSAYHLTQQESVTLAQIIELFIQQ